MRPIHLCLGHPGTERWETWHIEVCATGMAVFAGWRSQFVFHCEKIEALVSERLSKISAKLIHDCITGIMEKGV